MADIDKILSGLERLEHKKTLYAKLSAHLSLLIDDALPSDMLPVGVPRDVAVEVRDELQARLVDLDGDRSALLKPKKGPEPKAKRLVTPKARAQPVPKKASKKSPKPSSTVSQIR